MIFVFVLMLLQVWTASWIFISVLIIITFSLFFLPLLIFINLRVIVTKRLKNILFFLIETKHTQIITETIFIGDLLKFICCNILLELETQLNVFVFKIAHGSTMRLLSVNKLILHLSYGSLCHTGLISELPEFFRVDTINVGQRHHCLLTFLFFQGLVLILI